MKIKLFNKTFYVNGTTTGIVLGCVLLLIALIIGLAMKPEDTTDHPEVSATPSKEPYDAKKDAIDETEFEGTILPKTDDEGRKYIEKTLFLGDSNTARFLRFLNEDNKTFTDIENTIGVVGMGIDAISTLPCLDFVTGRFTMPQAVKMIQPERIIITFGTNNLYGNSTDATSFIERYEAQLKEIVKAYPTVDLIVNAIPPVTATSHYTNVYMQQIDAYNKAIVKMCEKNDWKFLNSSEALKDNKTGYAKTEYMDTDGLHFSQKGLIELFKYIRTHAYSTEDDRPKPLAAIPTIIGVPDGLIQINPLSNEEFTEEELTITTPEPTATPTPTATQETVVPTVIKTEEECVMARGKTGCWYNGVCYNTPEDAAAQQQVDAEAKLQAMIAECETGGGKWSEGTCVYPQPDPTPVCQDTNALNNGDMVNPCVYPESPQPESPDPQPESPQPGTDENP
ncbi:MAG: SGNH/GDSL hydrolase family protein [Solobacterium sp.]|nr:SGNH/GDSL hydrolase family protein [Solobacterium sp.]